MKWMWINTLWPSESVQAKPVKQTQTHPSTTKKAGGKPKEDMDCLRRVLCTCGFCRGNCTHCPPGGTVWGACILASGNLLKEAELNNGSWNQDLLSQPMKPGDRSCLYPYPADPIFSIVFFFFLVLWVHTRASCICSTLSCVSFIFCWFCFPLETLAGLWEEIVTVAWCRLQLWILLLKEGSCRNFDLWHQSSRSLYDTQRAMHPCLDKDPGYWCVCCVERGRPTFSKQVLWAEHQHMGIVSVYHEAILFCVSNTIFSHSRVQLSVQKDRRQILFRTCSLFSIHIIAPSYWGQGSEATLKSAGEREKGGS